MQQKAPPDVDKALDYACATLGGRLEGERRYGWGRKSAGSRILLPNAPPRWLRVQYSNVNRHNEKLWDGELEAAHLQEISKPEIADHLDWREDDLMWRGLLMEFIESPACSKRPELTEIVNLSEDWIDDLRRSLLNLSSIPTKRICCRQDLIDRRVKERYGEFIDTEISNWITCHGDVHWANITYPKMVLLDWEVWGLGPRGFDPALLLGFAGGYPDICSRIESAFSDWLSARDGIMATLFVSAELLRMIELYNDHPFLRESLESQGEQALRRLTAYD